LKKLHPVGIPQNIVLIAANGPNVALRTRCKAFLFAVVEISFHKVIFQADITSSKKENETK
jgi:hypothetical protein